jgi:hypothetical protein
MVGFAMGLIVGVVLFVIGNLVIGVVKGLLGK